MRLIFYFLCSCIIGHPPVINRDYLEREVGTASSISFIPGYALCNLLPYQFYCIFT